MATDFLDIVIGAEPLKIPSAEFDSATGAIVDFLGVVRGREGDDEIAGIDYEAHAEMARHQLERLSRAALEKFTIEKMTVHHRVGFVPVAEPSLFVRVTARHRGPAFAACEWMIEQLKRDVPIWKRAVTVSQNATP